MSNFICEKCGVAILDSPRGYITGCEHYPISGTPKEVKIKSVTCYECNGVCDSVNDFQQHWLKEHYVWKCPHGTIGTEGTSCPSCPGEDHITNIDKMIGYLRGKDDSQPKEVTKNKEGVYKENVCEVDCKCHDGGYSIKGCVCCIGKPDCKHENHDFQCSDCGKYFKPKETTEEDWEKDFLIWLETHHTDWGQGQVDLVAKIKSLKSQWEKNAREEERKRIAERIGQIGRNEVVDELLRENKILNDSKLC